MNFLERHNGFSYRKEVVKSFLDLMLEKWILSNIFQGGENFKKNKSYYLSKGTLNLFR
jgi:hypothetical protein